jgi:hypothetical protein
MGKARKLAREKSGITKQKEQPKPIRQYIWSWGVMAVVLSILLGAGYSFMTPDRVYVADAFFIAALVLFLLKFVSWEVTKKHERRVLVCGIAIVISMVLTSAIVCGNHYMNQQKHSKSFFQADPPYFCGGADCSLVVPGKTIRFNMAWKNAGSERLFDAFSFSRLYVVADPNGLSDTEVIQHFNQLLKPQKEEYLSGKFKNIGEIGIGHYIWQSPYFGPLSEKQCNGLFDGSVRIYILSWCAWKDNEGTQDSALSCLWLSPLPSRDHDIYSKKDNLAWHQCQEVTK